MLVYILFTRIIIHVKFGSTYVMFTGTAEAQIYRHIMRFTIDLFSETLL